MQSEGHERGTIYFSYSPSSAFVDTHFPSRLNSIWKMAAAIAERRRCAQGQQVLCLYWYAWLPFFA